MDISNEDLNPSVPRRLACFVGAFGSVIGAFSSSAALLTLYPNQISAVCSGALTGIGIKLYAAFTQASDPRDITQTSAIDNFLRPDISLMPAATFATLVGVCASAIATHQNRVEDLPVLDPKASVSGSASDLFCPGVFKGATKEITFKGNQYKITCP